MRRTQQGCIAAVLLALFAMTASAADITGQWKASYRSGDGAKGESTFTFKQEGEKLTGTVVSVEIEVPIQEGTVVGDVVTFVVSRKAGRGERKMTYTGKIVGDEIQFSILFDGAPKGGMGWQMVAKKVS
jgi:hypothetical protein